MAKEIRVAVVALIGTFDTANADVGTVVVETTAPGSVWIVGLSGTTKTLFEIDPAAALGQWATRVNAVTVTPGAGASGEVTYSGGVVNGAAAAVPRAFVVIRAQRTVGAGALSLGAITGTAVALVESSDEVNLILQADAAGLWSALIAGTAGDTISTTVAVDAPTGGLLTTDAGRVLP